MRKAHFILFFLLLLPGLIHAQSDDLIELSFETPIWNVTWSPTGSKLAFTTGEILHIYDRRGQNLQTIYLKSDGEPTHVSHLVWSENEQYIAVLSYADQSVGISLPLDVHVYLVEDGTLFLDVDKVLRDDQYIFGSIYHVDFSQDERMLSLISGQYIGGQAYDSNVYLVNMEKQEIQPLLQTARMGTSVSRTAWSPSGDTLAVDFGSSIELWDTTTREQVGSIRTGRTSTSVIYWQDEQTLTTVDAEVQHWAAQTGELLSSLPLLSTDLGDTRITTSYDPSTHRVQVHYDEPENRIEIFDGVTGQIVHRLTIEDLDDSKEHRYIFNAAGTAYASFHDKNIAIASIALPAVTTSVPDFTMEYVETALTSDDLLLNVRWRSDNTLVAQSEHGVAHLGERQTRWRRIQSVGEGQVIADTYSPSGRFQAMGVYDPESRIMNIQLWDLSAQRQLLEAEGYLGWKVHFTFSADENLLAVATADKFIRIWNIQTGELQQKLFGLGDFPPGFSPYISMTFSPDNRYLGAVGDELAHVWDMENGKYQDYSAFTEYAIPPYATTHITFGADSTSFMFRTIKFEGLYFQPATDEYDYPILTTFNDLSEQYPTRWEQGVFDIQVSHDGAVLATTDRLGNVKLFDASSQEAIPLPEIWCAETRTARYPIGIGSADWMHFSPDSTQFAFVMNVLCIPESLWDTGTDIEEVAQRNTIWVLDARTGELQHLLEDINTTIRTISFSPDGTMLLAELDGQPFALWETETFQRIN